MFVFCCSSERVGWWHENLGTKTYTIGELDDDFNSYEIS